MPRSSNGQEEAENGVGGSAAAPAASLGAPSSEGVAAASEDIGKPESFEVLGKTSWLRVRTSGGKKYFYNKETRVAVWKVPEEVKDLLQRLDKAAAALDAFDDWEAPDEDEDSDDSSDDDSDQETNPELEVLMGLARRMEDFKQMLREENFGPFAVYEKCLPRLVYQPRFSAITADQRRRLFDRCIKELAAESRRGQKEHIDAFRALLDEAKAQGHVHSSSTVDTLERRMREGERGRIREGDRGRVREGYRGRMREGDRGRMREGDRGRMREGDRCRMREGDRGRMREGDRGRMREGDRCRMREGERGRMREGDRCRMREGDRGRMREGDRGRMREGKWRVIGKGEFGHDERWQGGAIPRGEWAAIRKRLIEEMVARRREDKNEARDALRRQFKKFVKEQLQAFPSEDWPLRRREFRSHPLYTQVASAREREQLYQEACEDLTAARLERKRVAGASSILDDAETKKLKLLKADAATAFTNMLVERVKNPYADSSDGSEWPLELLQSDARFGTNSLTESEKKELYKAFVREFCTSRVSLFASRLTALPNEDLALPFAGVLPLHAPNALAAQVLEKLQTAKKLFQGIPEEELRPRHEAWREQRLSELADAFLLFLRQHPDVSRFYSDIAKGVKQQSGPFSDEQLTPLLEKLKADVRFQRLDAFPARRLQLLQQRLEELSKEQRRKGPGIAQSVKQQATSQRP
ncbi:FF domain-containing protein [Cyclospora cayetanensis]|uniref:FF domain-containing protein n=1 Tax=Cyclospora cayetanensis TaxID=88456 RepID=A0A1D3CYP0_9EIME|nr:FF domain-containing protein [Cyclospora cayetanensis]